MNYKLKELRNEMNYRTLGMGEVQEWGDLQDLGIGRN